MIILASLRTQAAQWVSFFHKRTGLSVIIFRYLTREVLGTLLVTTMILMVLFVTNQSVQYLQRAASGELPATALLQLIFLQVPLMLGYLLPLGLYLGVLLTFGRMYMESEMTVLFACGLSKAKLIAMVMTIAVFVAAIVAWLMADVVPKAQGDINTIFSEAAVTASVGKVIPGRFMTFGKGEKQIIFYAKQVVDHDVMKDVFLAKKIKTTDQQAGKQQKWGIIVAKTAQEKSLPGQSGQYLIFKNGHRYVGVPGQSNYQAMQFEQYGVRLTVDVVPKFNAVQYYSISKLWANYYKDKNAAAELQWRLALPISTLIFALLAVPLGEVQPRYGRFTQLFPAMLIYVSYADLMFLTRAWIRSGKISISLGMWWLHGVALMIALALMAFRMGWFQRKNKKR